MNFRKLSVIIFFWTCESSASSAVRILTLVDQSCKKLGASAPTKPLLTEVSDIQLAPDRPFVCKGDEPAKFNCRSSRSGATSTFQVVAEDDEQLHLQLLPLNLPTSAHIKVYKKRGQFHVASIQQSATSELHSEFCVGTAVIK